MKKIVLTLIGILIGLFLLLSVTTPENEYATEKRLWKVVKKFEAISKNVKKTPQGDFDSLIAEAEQFIKENQGSTLIPHAKLLIADVHPLKKDYRTARAQYEEIIAEYPEQSAIVEAAIIRIVSSYQKEKGSGRPQTKEQKTFEQTIQSVFTEEDSSAITDIFDSIYKQEDFEILLRAYTRAIKQYPATPLGIQAPFLIAKLYDDQGHKKESKEALQTAIQYYRTFAKEHEGTPLSLQAQRFLVSSYLVENNLSKAIETLGTILNEFSASSYLTHENAVQITILINKLSAQMANLTQASSIYQKFLTSHPKHRFSRVIEDSLQQLQALR